MKPKQLKENLQIITAHHPESPGLRTGNEGNFKSRDKEKHPPSGWGYTGLTPHERAILNLIAEGYKNQEIANELYMSEKAVRENQLSLMRKLNAPNLSSVIIYALEKGLINFYEVLESRFSKIKPLTN